MPAKLNPDRLDLLEALTEEILEEEPTPPAVAEGAWSWECDSKGNYNRCSDEILNELSVPVEEFLGRSIFTFRVDAETSAQLQEVHKRGVYPAQITARFLALNGTLIWVRMHIYADKIESAAEPIWYGFNLILVEPNSPEASPPRLESAIRLLKIGQTIEARRMIQKYLDRFPDDEQAWIWYATTFPGEDERLHILELFIENHPGRETARRAIETLQNKHKKRVAVRQAAFRAIPTIPILKSTPTPPPPAPETVDNRILIYSLIIIVITIGIAAAWAFLH
jgi:hypothetical protein